MTPEHLFATMEATWPAASRRETGIWTLRDGQGGGKRVSAATTTGDAQEESSENEQANLRESDAIFFVYQRTHLLPLDQK